MKRKMFLKTVTILGLTHYFGIALLAEKSKSDKCFRTIIAKGKIIKREVFPTTSDVNCEKQAKDFLASITNAKKKACIYGRKIVDSIEWQNAGKEIKKIHCKYFKKVDNPYNLVLSQKNKRQIALMLLNKEYKHIRKNLRAFLAANKGKSPKYIKKNYGVSLNKLRTLIEAYNKDGLNAFQKK